MLCHRRRAGASGFLLLAALCSVGNVVRAGAITLTGAITQDLADSLETASANPSLNNVADGDAYSVVLNFSGTISGPVAAFALSSIQFTDMTNSASENAFISGSLTMTQASGVDTFSVLGCLIDPSTCPLGNELDLNFEIPSTGLTQTGVTASIVPGLIPSMDLFEDSGNSEIQGSITGYSQSGAAPGVPEPSTVSLLMFGAAFLAMRLLRSPRKIQSRPISLTESA